MWNSKLEMVSLFIQITVPQKNVFLEKINTVFSFTLSLIILFNHLVIFELITSPSPYLEMLMCWLNSRKFFWDILLCWGLFLIQCVHLITTLSAGIQEHCASAETLVFQAKVPPGQTRDWEAAVWVARVHHENGNYGDEASAAGKGTRHKTKHKFQLK